MILRLFVLSKTIVPLFFAQIFKNLNILLILLLRRVLLRRTLLVDTPVDIIHH